MFEWKPNWWQGIILIILIIISTILSIPCYLLQKLGFKAKYYAKFLCVTGLEQLSYIEIIEYDIHK